MKFVECVLLALRFLHNCVQMRWICRKCLIQIAKGMSMSISKLVDNMIVWLYLDLSDSLMAVSRSL